MFRLFLKCHGIHQNDTYQSDIQQFYKIGYGFDNDLIMFLLKI